MSHLRDYIHMARPDHWIKNIFMVPGMIFAFLFTETLPRDLPWTLFLGLVSACLLASANYVINEWLDRHFDQHHPIKCARPAVSKHISGRWVYLEYGLLALFGLSIGAMVSLPFFLVSLFFLCMGICYNVPPIRTKDKAYLDVLSESINNPVRFLLGWSTIEFAYLPPSSVLLAYWKGGGRF